MSIIEEALRKADTSQEPGHRTQDKPTSLYHQSFDKQTTKWAGFGILSIILIITAVIISHSTYITNQNLKQRQITDHSGSFSFPPQSKADIPLAEYSPSGHPETRRVEGSPVLNGIVFGEGEPVAIINNSIMKKGDSNSGIILDEIYQDRVKVRYNKKELTLSLQQ